MTSQSVSQSAIYRFSTLAEHPLVHGITTRHGALPGDGDVNVAGRLPLDVAVENRKAWSTQLGIEATAIVCGRQVHGNGVRVVEATDAGRGAIRIDDALPATDALATRAIDLPLMIYTADCVPAIVYDPVQHALGLAHAGWRGTIQNVAGALVAEMQSAFGSSPEDLVVGIGPAIGPCCYEVGDEVIDAWLASGLDPRALAVQRRDDRSHLDLWRANTLAFELAGVPSAQIELARICTKCQSHRFFSRRAGNGHRGLFATIAALKGHEPDPRPERERRRGT